MYISELSFQKRDLLTLLVRICGDLSRKAGVEVSRPEGAVGINRCIFVCI
jgi:hypothetical protein